MIQTGSETLLDFQRETIEKAFKCKVYNWYGNTELCGHITECQYGNLHIQPRHSYVRIIKDDETEAKAGETGRIVATNYNNACFPLINYDTEDIVQISKKQECECGQNGTIIESIDGRIEDYIFLPDGRKVGRLDHIFKHTNNVKKAQIVQNKIDEVIIRINRNRKYSTSNEKEILKEARERLGNKINIELDYDTEITKEENGKFRFIKQNIKKKDL
jgi:phenylacetate-CoA ligase